MTLPAFPAERGRARACMRYRSIAGTRRRRPQLSIDRPISCPGWLSSKPAGRRWSMSRPTDGRTDTQPLHRPCSAQYAGSVNNQLISTHHLDWPSTPSDNLWKLIYLATEALSDSIEFIGAIEISLSIYLFHKCDGWVTLSNLIHSNVPVETVVYVRLSYTVNLQLVSRVAKSLWLFNLTYMLYHWSCSYTKDHLVMRHGRFVLMIISSELIDATDRRTDESRIYGST